MIINGTKYFTDVVYQNCIVCGKKQNNTTWTCSTTINNHFYKLENILIPDYIPEKQCKRYIIKYFKKERNNEKLE